MEALRQKKNIAQGRSELEARVCVRACVLRPKPGHEKYITVGDEGMANSLMTVSPSTKRVPQMSWLLVNSASPPSVES